MTDSRDAVQEFTKTTNAAVGQVRLVAKDAVAQIDAGTYGCEAWGRSMIKLFDIMARGSATHFQIAISDGCCPTSSTGGATCGMQPCDPIPVAADNDFSRELSVAVPFTRVGGQVTIPPNLIGFKPAVLVAGATSFAVYLRNPQYMGASYTGTVRLTRVTTNPADAGFTDEVVTVVL
jgi:hypothetical protein